MQSQQQPQTRSDSPDNNILQHIHPQDSLYTIHGSQNGMYSTSTPTNPMHIFPEYSADHDAQRQQQQAVKLNGFGANYHRASFTSYPNATRSRHHTTSSVLPTTSSYRDLYSSPADVFPAHMTSPIQSHMQPYDPRANFDYSGGQQPVNGGHKQQSYYVESYVQPNMLSSHPTGAKPQQPQPQHGAYPNQYSNNIHLSSQTPYGPHVPTGGPNSVGSTVSAGAGAPPSLMNGAASSNSEEISTIFVVGFPEDMQVSIIYSLGCTLLILS